MEFSVTPFVGVWIETPSSLPYRETRTSHPSWVCGLKRELPKVGDAPVESHPSWVCGLKLNNTVQFITHFMSHPSWVCGLKPLGNAKGTGVWGVTPFVGVWIETV